MSRRIEYALNQYALELSLPPMKMDDAGFASKIARTEFLHQQPQLITPVRSAIITSSEETRLARCSMGMRTLY